MPNRAHQQFADILDSAVRHTVATLNLRERAPHIETIDAIRKDLEQHALAFAALGAAFPRVFTPGPTLEQIEESDPSQRDTEPGFRSRFPPAPPALGEGAPPPLPRRTPRRP